MKRPKGKVPKRGHLGHTIGKINCHHNLVITPKLHAAFVLHGDSKNWAPRWFQWVVVPQRR